jgi:hypothetical protein
VTNNEQYFETELQPVNIRRLEINFNKSISNIDQINDLSFILQRLLSDKYPTKIALKMKTELYAFIKQSNASILSHNEIKQLCIRLYTTLDTSKEPLDDIHTHTVITLQALLKRFVDKL